MGRSSPSSRQILNALAGRSLTVTSACKQVTSTSRGRDQRQLRTCLFVCVPSGGSRWTTGRYDRPSPEQLQWTGCVGPSVSALAAERARPTRPAPPVPTSQQDERRQILGYIRHQASKSLADLRVLAERTAADCGRCLEGV